MGYQRSKHLLAFVFAAVLLPPVAARGQEATVHGRAVDREGKPMAGCAVGLFDLGERFDTKALLASPRTVTDAKGRYRLEAKQNHHHVVVVTTKGHQVCVQRLQSEAGAERHLPDALMLPGATLRGRVRDANGKPIAGATVRVEDPLTANTFVIAWFESMATSDDKGIFDVPGVPRTGLRVTASAPGFPAIERLSAHDSPLDFTLLATGLVRGRVLDADGAPVVGAEVSPITVEARIDGESMHSDAEGRFAITAPRAQRFRVHAYEGKAPYRQFTSALLHAAADDVVLTAMETAGEDRHRVTVRCVDAASKAPIEDFRVSWYSGDASTAILALLHHPEGRKPYHGVAVIDIVRDRNNKTLGMIVVDAPRHGFATMRVPEDPKEPFVAELPAECLVSGRVLDAETGKPAVGAAVRALPHAGLCGSGPDPFKAGVLTDANGRYRIGGLAPGPYDVQVYGVSRPASRSAQVTAEANVEATLDLEVPKVRFLEFELVGDIPPNCLGTILWQPFFSSSGGDIGVMLHAATSAPPIIQLSGTLTHKLGPIGDGQYRAQLRLPARDRIGGGQTLDLGEVTDGAQVRLPDLRQCLHTGRVQLPSDVPPERIALVARPVTTGREDWLTRVTMRETLAVGLASDGTFVIDLAPGKYALQLVDLATGFVFFTEAQDRELGPDTAKLPIDVKPAMHWLEIAIEPKSPGDDVVFGAIGVDLRRPRGGQFSAVLQATSTEEIDSSQVPFHSGSSTLRWLVPAGPLTVQPLQSFDGLRRPGSTAPAPTLDAVEIDIRDPVHRVTFRMPPPPGDAELERPAK